jgi:hypothetical protein
MFIQRTVKEQLEDALAKITILRAENSGLKQKSSDIIFISEKKINELEQKIKSLEEADQGQPCQFQAPRAESFFRNSVAFPNGYIERSQVSESALFFQSILEDAVTPNF